MLYPCALGFDVSYLDTLVLDAAPDVEVPPSQEKVSLQVQVIKSNGEASLYFVHVPRGSSLFEALSFLQDKQRDFM